MLKERKGTGRKEETPPPPRPSSVRRTLQGPALKRLCLGTCVQTPLPPLLPCLPPFSLLRSLLCHCLSLGKWRPLSPPSPCTGPTSPAWQGQGYQSEAKQLPFCLRAAGAVGPRQALKCPFCNSALHVSAEGLGSGRGRGTRLRQGLGRGAVRRCGGKKGSGGGAAAPGLVPGAIRSPGGAGRGGGAGAPTQAAVGPTAGGRMSDSELHPLRKKRHSSLLSCSPPHLRLPPRGRRYSQRACSL